MGRWIDGPGMELLDDRAEKGRQGIGQPPGKVQLFARPFGRNDTIPPAAE